MTREELAIRLAQDDRFKALSPEGRRVVFEEASAQLGAGLQQPAETLRPLPSAPEPQEFAPALAGTIRDMGRTPLMALPRLAMAGAFDAGRLIGAPVKAAATAATRASQGRPQLPPLQAIRQALYGAELPSENGQPSRMARAYETAGEIGVSMVPLGSMARSGLQQARHGLEQFSAPRPLRLETVDEVLRVPEARLPRLSQKERNAYFSARSQQIREQFQASGLALKTERVALQRELGKSAQQRSLYIREQLPALYSRQSSHYRALVDRELAPVANDLITDQEIRSLLMQRFAKDPERLNAVSGRLGLINESAQQAAGMPPPTYRVGELYQKALNLGQQIPRSVRESLRTYTPVEDATDDAIATLVDLLESKGVNLKEARGFWRSWAPIRNQATREFRPFIEPDVATRAGSQRLMRLAQGIDPDNEVYAKTLSELLEIDDLPGELRAIAGKLDTNQKHRLALALQQQEATGALQAMKFRVNQLADREARRWEKAKWVLGLATGGGVVAGAINQLRR